MIFRQCPSSPSLATAARGNFRRVGIGEASPASTGGSLDSLLEGSASDGSPKARPAYLLFTFYITINLDWTSRDVGTLLVT